MYAAALAELGFSVLGEGEFEGAQVRFLSVATATTDLSLHRVGSEPGRSTARQAVAHVAFTASDATAVDRWHRVALDHGATDNGSARAVGPSTPAITTRRS